MVRATIRIVVSLGILFTIVVAVQPSPVPASAVVVQQQYGPCWKCGSSSAYFSHVTSGDVIVVGVLYYGAGSDSVSISDNRGSKFTLVVSAGQSYPVIYEWLYIYVTTVTSSGNEFVTIQAPPPKISPELDLYMYEVSGVSAAQYIPYSSGTGVGYDFHIDNVGFNPGAFLLGIIGTICPEAYTNPIVIFAGQGYTLSPYLSPPNPGGKCTSLHAEYSTTGAETASFTTFSGTIAGTSTTPQWAEVGIVLNSNTSPVSITPLTTSTASQTLSTDWAVMSVKTKPSSPSVGTAVKLQMVMTAVSTTGGYPQNVAVQCILDGNSCGSGNIAYPGPTGASSTVSASNLWVATLGTHTLTWQINAPNDPNTSNNVMSISFSVPPSGSQSVSTTATQTSSTETSVSEVTVVQTQTVTQISGPSSTSSQPTPQPGILDIIQQNSLVLIGALALLVVALGVAMMKRGKKAP